MTRAVSVVKGLVALVLLVALVGGLPFALWHYVGWPLPHRVPSLSQLTSALGHHGIANTTLLRALACVVWVAWAILVASVAVELDAALRGRAARRLAVIGALQPVVGQLLAVVVLAAMSLAPRPGTGARPLAAAIGAGRRDGPGAAVTLVVDTAPAPAPAACSARAASSFRPMSSGATTPCGRSPSTSSVTRFAGGRSTP